MFGSIKHRFLLPTFTPDNQKNASFAVVFVYSKHNLGFEVKIDFSFHFGAHLASLSLPKSMKIRSKSDVKTHNFLNRFLHQMFNGLGFLLGAYVGLCRALCCPFFPCVDPFFDFFAGDSWGFPLGPCPGMVFSSIFTCSLFCFAPQLVLGVVRWLLNRYTLRSRTKAQYPTVL